MLSEQTLQLHLWLPEAVHASGVGMLSSLCRLAAVSWGLVFLSLCSHVEHVGSAALAIFSLVC